MGRKRARAAKGEQVEEVVESPARVDRIEAKNEAQAQYMIAIDSASLVFGLGPAGTGKTFLAAAMAAEHLKAKRVSRIIVTRPAIEAGENLGFLPGSLEEKFEPYFAPVRAAFVQRLGKSHVDLLLKRKTIEVIPLAYMRGHTFDNTFVLFDEAQNASRIQMKTLLTRVGEWSKVVVNGDTRQVDIGNAEGLRDAVRRLRHLRAVRVCEFTRADVVRSGLAREIVEAYESDIADQDMSVDHYTSSR